MFAAVIVKFRDSEYNSESLVRVDYYDILVNNNAGKNISALARHIIPNATPFTRIWYKNLDLVNVKKNGLWEIQNQR